MTCNRYNGTLKDCGIYKITNCINGKIYVGSSIDAMYRLRQHRWMLKKNRHDNTYLQRSYNKHGRNNFSFEVIERCEESFLIHRENYHIKYFESDNASKGYNLATVNEFRRNNHNEGVKIGNSIKNLKLYGNFSKFKSINTITGQETEYESLVPAARYLVMNGFSKGKLPTVRQEISYCLRGIIRTVIKNGVKMKERNETNKDKRTAYKHKWVILN